MNKFWEKDAIGYQIYLKSFFDSNDDGIGDIEGVVQKLDYIKDMGFNFIWISPFYDSPMDDNGYDVRNYYKIYPAYGNIKSVDRLISEAHKRNIKVIIDLVLNHTSNENDWFIKSVNKENGYENFYYWKDAVIDNTGNMQPSNNWKSFFGGSAWEYNKQRKQYYLRIFSSKMPDINYSCPKAIEEITKVIEYWANKGVDGFRLDAIAHLGKDLTFKNYSISEKYYSKFSNLKNNFDYLKKLQSVWQKYNIITMGEVGGDASYKILIKYCKTDLLNATFSFEQVDVLNTFIKNKTIDVKKLKNVLNIKQKINNMGGWSMLFWLNHDHYRLASIIEDKNKQHDLQLCLAVLMYMSKGTPIIYNGEEIGMTNYPFASINEFCDVDSINKINLSNNIDKTFNLLSRYARDNARTIMQWNSGKYAGFSTTTPWYKINPNYKNINIENMLANPNSLLNQYKKIIKLRKKYANILYQSRITYKAKNNVIYTIINGFNMSLHIYANLGSIPFKINIPQNTKLEYCNITNSELNILQPFQTKILVTKK